MFVFLCNAKYGHYFIFIGYFLKKILDDFNTKIAKVSEDTLAKIYLYSGHESTLGHILDALKIEPHVSGYGSAVIFELHKTEANHSYYAKVLTC